MLELIFWIISLFLLYVLDPSSNLSLCILHNLGINECIGCGFGKSIHYFLMLDIQKSFSHHWFGAFSVLIIVCRIFKLTKATIRSVQWKQ